MWGRGWLVALRAVVVAAAIAATARGEGGRGEERRTGPAWLARVTQTRPLMPLPPPYHAGVSCSARGGRCVGWWARRGRECCSGVAGRAATPQSARVPAAAITPAAFRADAAVRGVRLSHPLLIWRRPPHPRRVTNTLISYRRVGRWSEVTGASHGCCHRACDSTDSSLITDIEHHAGRSSIF